VHDAVDEQGRRAQHLARSQAAIDILADPVRHRDAGLPLHVRRDRLAQPQRGSQVDVDHEPQRLRGRGERVSRPERTNGVHQHVRGPNLAGDPVDERCHLILVIRSPGELADLEHVQAEPFDLCEHAV
jgi:hypothetical protein